MPPEMRLDFASAPHHRVPPAAALAPDMGPAAPAPAGACSQDRACSEPVKIKPKLVDPVTSSIGRRAAPRLRLSLPAQLIAVEKAHTCILLNLSRTGAQVAILDAMREGEGAILRCGVINHFAIVTRNEFGLNALSFEEKLTDAIVLETRRYHENFEERERRALIETARKWATGETDDRTVLGAPSA